MKKEKNTKDLIFGINSFGDIPVDEAGNRMTDAEAIRQVVDESVIADELGVDVIGLGEHHRPEYSISSPEMVLAGIARETENIKLSSAVTVLSSDDPVRVYERFATLDALSEGRAQVILGRGSFTESFPLFGYKMTDYNELFEEKMGLFKELLKERPVTWSGSMRASLKGADVYPKTENGPIKTFVGVGGSPESVIRAVRNDFPIIFAIIGGAPERFLPYLDLYKQSAEKYEMPAHPIGVHSPGFIADTDEEAVQKSFPYFKTQLDRIGRERGWRAMSRSHFADEVTSGSMYVGSPETVARRIAQTMQTLGLNRFDMVYGFGPVPARERLRMVELYGKEVVPRVKEILEKDRKS